jgi:RNA polymerase sigma-70 factor (ECF subfamily)
MALSRDDIARAYREHGFRVFLRVRRILGSEAEARDVLQEVFVTLLDRRFFVSDPERLGPWLLKVGTNRALNRLRDRSSRARILDGQRLVDLEEALTAGTPTVVARETVRLLLELTDARTRELALAYFFDGYTLPEIATLYETPVTTVHRRLQAFLASSRKVLEHDGVGGGAS